MSLFEKKRGRELILFSKDLSSKEEHGSSRTFASSHVENLPRSYESQQASMDLVILQVSTDLVSPQASTDLASTQVSTGCASSQSSMGRVSPQASLGWPSPPEPLSPSWLAAQNDQLITSCLDTLPDDSCVSKKIEERPDGPENVFEQHEDIEFLMHPPPDIKTWKIPLEMALKTSNFQDESKDLSDENPGKHAHCSRQNPLKPVSFNLNHETQPSAGLPHCSQETRNSNPGNHPEPDFIGCNLANHLEPVTCDARSEHGILPIDHQNHPRSSDLKPKIRPKPEFLNCTQPKPSTGGVKPKTSPKPEILVHNLYNHSKPVTSDMKHQTKTSTVLCERIQSSNDCEFQNYVKSDITNSKAQASDLSKTAKKEIENKQESTSCGEPPGNQKSGVHVKKPRTHPKPLSLDILKRFEDTRY
jgi:hypothetical protein